MDVNLNYRSDHIDVGAFFLVFVFIASDTRHERISRGHLTLKERISKTVCLLATVEENRGPTTFWTGRERDIEVPRKKVSTSCLPSGSNGVL